LRFLHANTLGIVDSIECDGDIRMTLPLRKVTTQQLSLFQNFASIACGRVFDEAGNVIETHEHAGDFKEW
jgi:hypothetical protein